MKFVQVFLFAFLVLSFLSRFTVVAETVNTGVVGELVAAESFDNGIIVFYTSELDVGFDLNGDGDESDCVIRYYNVSSGMLTNTTVVGDEPAIGGNIIAFTTYEGYIDEDLNGDGDTDDYVIRYYDILSGTTGNTSEIGYDAAVDNGIITFTVAEGGLDKDLNEDGDKVDRFIWYYNVSSGEIFNSTTILGAYASKDGNIIAFETWEEWDGVDLNGDGDTTDSIIRYYDMFTETIVNTAAAGYEPSIDGDIIAFCTDESEENEDLNNDGDTDDQIIRYYNISSGIVTNTTAYGDFPCVKGDIIAFETWESDFGNDLNGDDDTDDNVIRYYNISDGTITSTAEMGYYASVEGRKIAFYTYESDLDEDVNGDGDKDDSIIRYYVIPQIHQGDLILDDNDVYVIEGEFNINGSIIVTENATLILKNAVINFMQTSDWQYNMSLRNPLNGNPRLQAKNTTITSDYKYKISLASNTFANVSDSKFIGSPLAYCWLWVSGSATFHNLTVYGLSISGSFDTFLSDSFINSLNVYSGSVSAYNSTINSAITYGSGQISMNKCTVHSLSTFDQSRQYVSNSTVEIISTKGNSSVWLTNSSFTEKYLYNNSKVFILWYLDVHVIDSEGTNIPNANTTAYYPNGTLAESKLTETNGRAKLTLLEKMLNATGEYPVGNYTITATYETHEGQESVNMTENKEITIQLPFIIPEFPTNLLITLLIAVTTTLFALKRFKKLKLKPLKQ